MSLEDLVDRALHDFQAARLAQLTSGVIIIFDHIITLDDELCGFKIQHWISHLQLKGYHWIASTAMHLLVPPSVPPPMIQNFIKIVVGTHYLQWQNWTGLVACMIGQVILQMRLYALYSLNKKVLVLMMSMFIISSATSAAIMGMALSEFIAVAHPLPDTTICIPVGFPTYYFTIWIPITIFETLLCGLAFYRGFQTFHTSASVYQPAQQLFVILIRDSVVYFVVMLAIYFTIMVFCATTFTGTLFQIPIIFSVTFSCSLISRMILNIYRGSLIN
ncbi:hypothetical protein DFH08DRAFT_1035216 [Mycena albidolilacea]|uniref:Uncharacterized protein n=1 Tax=Mycena albidolilacea TaxID=1033008 RepID=A0AAD6ZF06_9AGAR|nr:hypothetical protein DFH08DRAFT_1035216 [Mycena albidolilacea]